jgi:hypothetical protein
LESPSIDLAWDITDLTLSAASLSFDLLTEAVLNPHLAVLRIRETDESWSLWASKWFGVNFKNLREEEAVSNCLLLFRYSFGR